MTIGEAAARTANEYLRCRERKSRGGTSTGGSSSNMLIVSEADVDDAIDRHVGITTRTPSPVPGSRVEESQHGSVLREAALQAESSASASTRRSNLASKPAAA